MLMKVVGATHTKVRWRYLSVVEPCKANHGPASTRPAPPPLLIRARKKLYHWWRRTKDGVQHQ